VCCSVLQCVAVCCRVLHDALLRVCSKKWRLLQCVAVCCSVLFLCCSGLQCVAVYCNVLQCVAVRCSVLQCVADCVAECYMMPY